MSMKRKIQETTSKKERSTWIWEQIYRIEEMNKNGRGWVTLRREDNGWSKRLVDECPIDSKCSRKITHRGWRVDIEKWEITE